MPFENSWENRGFYTKFWGTVTHKEIETKNRDFSSDPRSYNCLYQIFDGTEIDAFEFAEGDLVKIASNDIGMGFYLKDLSVVLVSEKPEIQAVYQQYLKTCQLAKMTWKFHICDTVEQAREWLTQQKNSRVWNLQAASPKDR